MKKARAARDRASPKTATLPPPLPLFDELDALAASSAPTVEAAWWIWSPCMRGRSTSTARLTSECLRPWAYRDIKAPWSGLRLGLKAAFSQ